MRRVNNLFLYFYGVVDASLPKTQLCIMNYALNKPHILRQLPS